MVPAFETVPGPPVTKTPKDTPEIDALELLVTLAPCSRSAPAPPAAVPLMLPLLVMVAAPPSMETPDAPEMEPPTLFATLPPPRDRTPAPGAVIVPVLLSVPNAPKPTPPVMNAPALFVTVPDRLT